MTNKQLDLEFLTKLIKHKNQGMTLKFAYLIMRATNFGRKEGKINLSTNQIGCTVQLLQVVYHMRSIIHLNVRIFLQDFKRTL